MLLRMACSYLLQLAGLPRARGAVYGWELVGRGTEATSEAKGMGAKAHLRALRMVFQYPDFGRVRGRWCRSRVVAVAEAARGLGASRPRRGSLGTHAPRGSVASGTGAQQLIRN